MSKALTIVTHNGGFHADEVFAVAALKLHFTDREVVVKRSRETADWETADIVVDVGAIYDEGQDRFDHHQVGGAGVRDNNIPYASFGLVWKKYGAKLCGSEAVASLIEKKLVLPIDAIDNGVEIYKPLYEGIHLYSIMDIYRLYRPTWRNRDPDAYDKGFQELLILAQNILWREIIQAKDLLEGRGLVLKTYQESSDKKILVFAGRYPWKDFTSQLTETIFVVYPKLDGTWAAESVRPDQHSFANKKSFPDAWAGKRGQELIEATGVPEAIFCHRGAYLVITKTKESALALAKKALQS